ncbi:MAG: lysophospholipid acyltransferase family protein [Thermodesulfobacteriota bacterium]
MKKKRKKSKSTQLIEYIAAYTLILFIRALPVKAGHLISGFLGNALYLLIPKRRNIAIKNLTDAYKGEKSEKEISKIARQSCKSFFLTAMEIIKFQTLLTGPDALNNLRTTAEGLDELFRKAKELHEKSKGCIFVTPHIGNWEFLPHACSMMGIPIVVVARPLDNAYLEKLIYEKRALSGQLIIPKRNALFRLQKALNKGHSIGMLPDQSIMKGISVDFFGHAATTTPIPAILAIMYKKPIVVVASCRRKGKYQFEGFVSDPIWPGEYKSEKAEIFRLTEEMNKTMESIIRKYPEQYVWVHNRWKTYAGKKDLMA